jgi:hypothetical protein
MEEDKLNEQIGYMIASRGWYHFKTWMQEQIDIMSNKIVTKGITNWDEYVELRVKIQTFREILNKPEEMSNKK